MQTKIRKIKYGKRRISKMLSADDKGELERIIQGEISFEDLIRPKIDEMIKEGTEVDVWDDTTEADAEIDRRLREGLKIILNEKKRLGLPIVRYDGELKRSYIEWPDGEREYAD